MVFIYLFDVYDDALMDMFAVHLSIAIKVY